MKVKVMKKVMKKKAWPLTVMYGVKPEVTIPLVTHIDRCVAIDLGWITLHVGWDEKWSEIIFAITEKETFLLSAASSVSSVLTGAAKSCDWVYAIECLPDDFLDGVQEPTVLKYFGFRVKHGVDFEKREFVSVEMPNAELHLLFRNPASFSSQAWSPRKAVAFEESMLIPSFMGAKTDLERQPAEGSLDAELLQLIGELTSLNLPPKNVLHS